MRFIKQMYGNVDVLFELQFDQQLHNLVLERNAKPILNTFSAFLLFDICIETLNSLDRERPKALYNY